MILIKIGDEERQFEAADERWITEQVNRRRIDGVPACVRIVIRQGDLNMTLSTPGCSSSGGAGRQPNSQETAILELWEHRGLNDATFSVGNLVAFLHQLKRNL